MCTHSESIIKILTAGHIFSESAFIRTYAWNYDESAAESTGSMSAPSFPASPTTVTGEPGDSRLEGCVQRTFLPVLRRNIFPWGPWLAVVDLLSEHTCMRLCDPLGFCTVPLTLSIISPFLIYCLFFKQILQGSKIASKNISKEERKKKFSSYRNINWNHVKYMSRRELIH